MLSSKIFKTYDIRGIYPDEVNEEAAEKIGAASAKYWGEKINEIVVARDARLSSPSLFEALARGIVSQGKNVVNIGICTNPLFIFTVKNRQPCAGIFISASHSPRKYNGFKINAPPGIQLTDDKYAPIKELVLGGEFSETQKKGEIVEINVLDAYAEHIIKNSDKAISELRVVVDYGNGVGSITAKPIFEKLGLNVIPMYEEPDGNFPNHLADPHNIENMQELQKRVKSEKADLGIFFDGDADRAYIIDENGEIVSLDFILALLAEEKLKKFPGQNVYYDLRFSRIVKETIEKNGGKAVMMRVGNPFYKEKMMFEGGAVAAEFSGHIFTNEGLGIDDGLLAAIQIMNIVAKSGKKISELAASFQKYFATPEISLRVVDSDAALKKAAEKYKDGHSIDLDGVYIEYPDWWFSLRKSNTEPVVRLRLEADTEELMKEKKEELIELIGC
jgi:phosphomannomutase